MKKLAMKKQARGNRKLTLGKETVRQLDDLALGAAAGGVTVLTTHTFRTCDPDECPPKP